MQALDDKKCPELQAVATLVDEHELAPYGQTTHAPETNEYPVLHEVGVK